MLQYKLILKYCYNADNVGLRRVQDFPEDFVKVHHFDQLASFLTSTTTYYGALNGITGAPVLGEREECGQRHFLSAPGRSQGAVVRRCRVLGKVTTCRLDTQVNTVKESRTAADIREG